MDIRFSRRHRHALKSGTALLLAHLTLGVAPGLAQQTWNGSSNDWGSAGSWTPNGVPDATTDVIVDATGGGLAPVISGAFTVNTLAQSSRSLLINAGSSLTTVGGYVLSGDGTLLNSGTIVGAFTMQGTGTASLLGTLDGNLSITSGQVAVSNAVTGATTIGGGTLFVNASGDLADGQTLTVNGGTVNVNASDTVGALAGTGGAVNIAANQTLTAGASNASTSFAGVLIGSGNFTKTGAGTLVLSGANTHSGITTVSGGVLNIRNATGLGTTAAGTTVDTGAALELQGGIGIGTEALTLNGSGVGNGGALRNVSGFNGYAGAITLGSAARINSDADRLALQSIDNAGHLLTLGGAGDLLVSGVISGTGGLTKDGAGTAILSGDNTYSGTTTISAGTLQISNGGTAGTLGSGNVVNNGALVFDRSNALTYAGAISGTGSLTKNGADLLNLSGVHTYTGTTTINSGEFRLSGTGSLGATNLTNGAVFTILNNASTGTATVTNNATMELLNNATLGSATVTNNGNLNFFNASSAGNAQITNNETTAFFITSTAGNATITTNVGAALDGRGTFFNGSSSGGTSTQRVNAGGLLDITQHTGPADGITIGSLAGAGLVAIGGKTLTVGSNNNSTTFSGVIQNEGNQVGSAAAAGNLVKTGTGTLSLSGANTFTGTTTINQGALNIQNAAGLGTTDAGTTVNAGAALELQGGTAIGAEALTLNGSGVANGGALRSISGSNDYGGPITLGSASRINTDAGQLTLSGTIDNGGFLLSVGGAGNTAISGVISGAGGLTKDGAGSVTLTRDNTYAGTTTISAGTLQVGGAGTLGTLGTGDIVNNGTLVFNRSDAFTVANGISGTGALFQIGAGTLTLTGANTSSGTTTILAGTLQIGNGGVSGALGTGNVVNNGALVFNRSNALTFGGAISGTGSLTQNGVGTTTLTGALTYTGNTTVAAGMLEIAGSGSLGGTSVTNDSELNFLGTASAGNAAITNNAGGSVAFSAFSTAGLASITNDGGAVGFFDNASAGNANITNDGFLAFEANATAGNAAINNLATGLTVFLNNANAGSAAILNSGLLGFADMASAGNATILNNGGMFFEGNATAGNATITNDCCLTFEGNATAGNATIINNDLGTVEFLEDTSAGNAVITNTGNVFFAENSTAGNATITTPTNFATTAFIDSATGGTARFILDQGGTLSILNRPGGVSIGSLEGVGGVVRLGAETLSVGTRNTSTTFGGVINDDGLGGGLTKVGTGTLTLTGASTYTGPTQVDAGRLVVNGSLASPVTIGANGSFGGSGTIPQLTVNGTVSPGNSPGTLTINGNVVFGPGSVYVAEVEGAQADRINAAGTAALAGTLRLVPLGGAYLFNTPYTLLRAQGGRTGAFAIVETQGLFGAGVRSTIGYSATDVSLTLEPGQLTPVLGPFAARNPRAVAAGFDAGLAAGGNIDPFFPLYNLPAANLPGALNTFSGEVHTSAAAMGFDVQGRFLATMLDPFALGRRGNAGAPAFYAAEQSLKAPGPLGRLGRTTRDVPMPDPRYSVWGSVFGATGHVDGSAGAGSAKRESDHAGLAVGADWRLNPNAAIGFSVSGAKANASLANGLGSAEADAFQAGLYGMARMGDLSFGLSAAYSWLDVEARRSVPVLGFQPLSGDYDAHGFGIRAEAAWAAFRTGGVTFSPTAAVQAQSVRTDAFRETAAAGAGAGVAALAVNGRTANAARTELGLRLDADFRAGGTDVTAFASVAWAHHLARDITMSASLAALPGSNFVVEGARRDRDAALVGLGLDVKLTPTVSLTARADGAFSANASEIGGSAALRVRF